jgi:hypothetical protein
MKNPCLTNVSKPSYIPHCGFLATISRLFYVGHLTVACLVLTPFSFGKLLAADTNTPINGLVMDSAPWAPAHVTYICDSTNAEPTYQNLPVSQWLQTKTLLNPNHLSLSKLLTLKQVSQPDEMSIVRFELPVKHDAVETNGMGGSVDFGVINKDGYFVDFTFSGWEQAADGGSQLWWVINYNAPGKHNIRARLNYYNGMDGIEIIGPPLQYDSSNVCQFFEGYSLFDSTGALLQAKLRQQVAKYRIELATQKGKHLKTITGSSTNGVINLEWDLKDDHGKKFKGDSFEGAFYVIYPDDTHTNAPARDYFNRIPDPSN